MTFFGKALPRRTLLRGAGALLALPLLDAMVPARAALADTPAAPAKLRRLGFVYMPMGCDVTRWTPPSDAAKGTAALDELSPTLSPLAAVKQKVAVISNLELRNAYPGTHATSNAAFLSAAKAKRTESTDYHLGTTVDQIAARQLGRDTQLPSLELSMDLLSVVVDGPPLGRRPVRQRLCLRLSEQPLLVVAHHAAASRGPSAGGVREPLWRGGGRRPRRGAQEAGEPARFRDG
jgi:hypothetical protein